MVHKSAAVLDIQFGMDSVVDKWSAKRVPSHSWTDVRILQPSLPESTMIGIIKKQSYGTANTIWMLVGYWVPALTVKLARVVCIPKRMVRLGVEGGLVASL